MSECLSNKGVEAGDKAADEIRHFLKDFNNRLDRKNLRLVQRYREMEIQILVRFRAEGFTEDYVAAFEHREDGWRDNEALLQHEFLDSGEAGCLKLVSEQSGCVLGNVDSGTLERDSHQET